jgi:hypothetical protein
MREWSNLRYGLLLGILLLGFVEMKPAVAADDLPWPLKIEISPSSSYAEFRGMRFHGGIDLRTRQSNGIPIYSIADGFVSRLKVQHRGFGYALYVDHPGLKVRAVYGHLDDYAQPMAGYVEAKLKKMGVRYGLDDSFGAEKFPVKKGQLIAYTGETGIGPSHLHFELRTFNDEPLSPTAVGYRVPDKIIPELIGLHIDPLSPTTVINGRLTSTEIPLKKQNPSLYGWQNPIVISGKAGFHLGLIDHGEGGNRFGVEFVTVLLDGKKIYEWAFQQYSYDDNIYCPYVYDYPRTNRPGTGYVYTLFRKPFGKIPFAGDWPDWAGCLGDQAPGNHRLEITAVDFGGNKVTAAGPVVIAARTFGTKTLAVKLEPKSIVFTEFAVIADCQAEVAQTGDAIWCVNGQGQKIAVPALITGKQVQLAFPISREWADGARCQGIEILPALTYVDKKGGEISTAGGPAAIFGPDALNLPILGFWKKRPDLKGTAVLPARSAGWELHPRDLVTHKPMKILMPFSGATREKRLGIYTGGGGKPSHVGGNAESLFVQMTSRWLGPVIVLEDTAAPVVSAAGTRTIKRLGLCRVFRVEDTGEGINYDACTALIDGNSGDIDSDPDRRELYVPVSGHAPGVKVSVRVFDHAGNLTELGGSIKKPKTSGKKPGKKKK